MDKGLMLKEIREHYRLHKNIDFAQFFGLSEQNAYSWTKRGFMDIELVYEKCPDIDPEWLLSSGEKGQMLRKDNNQSVIGDNNTTANGDIHGASDEALNKALDALAEEQKMCAKFQEQQDAFISLLGQAMSK